MKLSSPGDADLREKAKESEWTVGAPSEDIEIPDNELRQLQEPVYRTKNGTGAKGSVVTMVEPRSENQSDIRNFRIDFSLLQKILYEHRRYAFAQGFSDAEMDVLRSIEFHDADRVGVDEIMEDRHCEEYAESTVYKTLRTLQEKELISKVRPGVYRYSGP